MDFVNVHLFYFLSKETSCKYNVPVYDRVCTLYMYWFKIEHHKIVIGFIFYFCSIAVVTLLPPLQMSEQVYESATAFTSISLYKWMDNIQFSLIRMVINVTLHFVLFVSWTMVNLLHITVNLNVILIALDFKSHAPQNSIPSTFLQNDSDALPPTNASWP